MSHDLDVRLIKPVRISALLDLAPKVLGDILALKQPPELGWRYPPNVGLRATTETYLQNGVGLYFFLSSLPEYSSVDFGVSDRTLDPGGPSFAWFGGVHDGPVQSVLALAMAIALAQLTGSDVEDVSRHWSNSEINNPLELLDRYRLDCSEDTLLAGLEKVAARVRGERRLGREQA